MTETLTELPDEDAPISAWCKPVSGTLTTRLQKWFRNIPETEPDISRRDMEPEADGGQRTKMRRRQITPELVAQMIALRDRGAYQHEIAMELGVSTSVVGRSLLRHGLATGARAHNRRGP